MKELFLLVLAGAVLGSFSSLFEGKQVRDASFYMVYLLALALILKNFQSSGENLKAVITSLIAFMRILRHPTIWRPRPPVVHHQP